MSDIKVKVWPQFCENIEVGVKINYIKQVRTITGLGLKDAKDFTEGISEISVDKALLDKIIGLFGENNLEIKRPLTPVEKTAFDFAEFAEAGAWYHGLEAKQKKYVDVLMKTFTRLDKGEM